MSTETHMVMNISTVVFGIHFNQYKNSFYKNYTIKGNFYSARENVLHLMFPSTEKCTIYKNQVLFVSCEESVFCWLQCFQYSVECLIT